MTTTGFRQGDLAPPPSELTYDLVSWLVAGVALFLTLALHLLPALLAGLWTLLAMLEFLETHSVEEAYQLAEFCLPNYRAHAP